jgi:hypothetical protein
MTFFNSLRFVFLCALSLSVGWGIRGNFGHEFGAMIPGALAAMAAVALSQREDWQRRGAYFAMLGALGWSFGGSISYMWVIGYTHSGQMESQIYGYACLFIIGFTWAAIGGAGTALSACVDRAKLVSLFPPMLAVFAAWWLQDQIVPQIEKIETADERHLGILYWYDTDWIAALLAILAVALLAAARRRFDWGCSLVMHLAIGWWAGFLTVVIANKLGYEFRMTPPRGDNWSGVLGMVGGMLLFLLRHKLKPVAYAALACGTWGGLGFVGATLLKLIEVKYVPVVLSQLFGPGAWQTNWHSVLEQTYGFINGIGIGLVMLYLTPRLPAIKDEPANGHWTEGVAVAFVLLLIPYLNIVKNVGNLIKEHAVPSSLYGWPTIHWFQVACGLLALAFWVLYRRHRRRPLSLIPVNPLGQVQLLYLALLWVIVLGNLAHAIPGFSEQRLITEGVIHCNAVICTLGILLWPEMNSRLTLNEETFHLGLLVRKAIVAFVVMSFAAVGFTWATRAIWGNEFAGQGAYHVRFGPDAPHGEPSRDRKHP